jgi:hypothetical protein
VGLLADHPTKFVFKRDRSRAKLFTPRRASDSAIVFQIAASPRSADVDVAINHSLKSPTVIVYFGFVAPDASVSFNLAG